MKQLIFLLGLVLLASCNNQDNKVYQFRGEGRTGIYPDINLLGEWPEDGPEEVWAIETVGNGFCSPIFVEDKFFIAGETDGSTLMYCFNLEGEKQWETLLGGEWMKTYPGSRMAPTIVDGLLYTGTGLGNLYCLDADDGELIWKKNFIEDFDGLPMLHGYSEAPVIDGDKVFWTPGGKELNAVGLNRYTGELIWSNKGLGERSGYNQGQLIELPSRKIYVTFSAYHIMGFDTETGELLWSQEQDVLPLDKRTLGYGDTHTNPVLFYDGSIYYSTADGLGGVKLELSEDGSEISQVWRNLRFDGLMGGMVKLGDYIYSESFGKPKLLSINCESGIIIDSLELAAGSLISAEDLLYYYSYRGSLNLISADQGKMKVISSFKITKGTKQHFAHPVINDGIIYLRHGNVLMAFNIREK
jgi:outer membrane protein assembly factor BamB